MLSCWCPRKWPAHLLNSQDSSQMMSLCTTILVLNVTFPPPPDPLPSPTLGCNWVNESISVHCEVPQSYRRHRELLRYAWNCSSQQCESSSQLGALVPNSPPDLHFTKDDDLSQEVHCFVENPESNRTSSKVLSTCVPAGEYTATRPVAEMLYSNGVHGPVVVCGFQTTGIGANIHFTNSKCQVSYNVHGHPSRAIS